MLVLPNPPSSEVDHAVRAWFEPVVIPTYAPDAPDANPIFLKRRVYQGSSGRVYPLPFIDRIATSKDDRPWEAVHLENEYLRLMILPELGGRLHVAFDKRNGYDFFYRQNVIKPALVGLAGPWISGGMELNWPQHHRPSTFLPCEASIERHEDGSVTVWLSEHEPMQRMKGMHGFSLSPRRASIELKVRVHNRTSETQTFLFWANVAARVHEKYQSFFPPDVDAVADHARRAVTRFPLSDGHYYGVNYGARASRGIPEEELPPDFRPEGVAPNDLRFYANIPVPTSYMVLDSRYDFFGGYDHRKNAGFVHVANRHVAPGKKQWTWGNHPFGYAWDRNLTDEDGPYIELMAGSYTDNQPDFSFLAPHETRTFQHDFFPILEIGPPVAAGREGALSLEVEGRKVRIAVAVPEARPDAIVRLHHRGNAVGEWSASLSPSASFFCETTLDEAIDGASVRVEVCAGNRVLFAYDAAEVKRAKESRPPLVVAKEPAPPAEIATNEELYLVGVHLEQYRHATRSPEPYFREAIARDPFDSRCHTALGRYHLRRGELDRAEEHLRQAIRSLTRYNPNPRDGEAHYTLGRVLAFRGDDEAAHEALFKATWNQAFQSAAHFELARLESRRRDFEKARRHLERCLERDVENTTARNLLVVVLRALGAAEEAATHLARVRASDPLDVWSRYLMDGALPNDGGLRLDLAWEYGHAGLYAEAATILEAPIEAKRSAWNPETSLPMVHYTCATMWARAEESERAHEALVRAEEADPRYCFPSRDEDRVVLEEAIRRHPAPGQAFAYLGMWLYDRDRSTEAMAAWEEAVRHRPENATAWRNLGIAYYNVARDGGRARSAYERAIAASPNDARLFYERDQLWQRLSVSSEERLATLEARRDLVDARDDLTVELAALYNDMGQPERALALLTTRRFQPWEGGEGRVLGQHDRARILLARRAIAERDPTRAIAELEAVLSPPENLGEARHLLASTIEPSTSSAKPSRWRGRRPKPRRTSSVAPASSETSRR